MTRHQATAEVELFLIVMIQAMQPTVSTTSKITSRAGSQAGVLPRSRPATPCRFPLFWSGCIFRSDP